MRVDTDEAIAYWMAQAAAHSKRMDELYDEIDKEQEQLTLANENIRTLHKKEAA